MKEKTMITFFIHSIGMMGVLFSSFYIFGKSIKYDSSVNKKALSILWCILWAGLSAIGFTWLPLIFFRPLYCVFSIFLIYFITKLNLDKVISAFLFSYGISYTLYYISVLSIAPVFAFISRGRIRDYQTGSPFDFNEPMYLLMYTAVFLMQLVMAVLLFRIRRFRKGFPFLFERYTIILALIVTGILLVMISLLTPDTAVETRNAVFLLTAGVLIIGIGIYIWIRRGIKKFQRNRTRERNEQLLIQENEELKRELELRNANYEILRAANHSINHRMAAMERRIAGIIKKGSERNFSAEFSEELAFTLTDIRKLSEEYAADVGRTKDKIKLPSTNIRMLDDMFGLFFDRFSYNNIYFKLRVNGSIIYMTKNVIQQNKLETMVGDHLQNALNAVNADDKINRGVLAFIGESGDYYEFSVRDSGIPFEADTLARLGLERVTTHVGAGGSGVGFMRTFDVMRECGASLIIKEIKPGGTFSKSVTFRFDGKNKFIIDTYRPEMFMKSDRYTIIHSI